MGKIKAGVIGIGFIAPLHIEAMRRLGFVDVIAIARSSKEEAKSSAKTLSIPVSYGSYDELIQDPEVEVVHICTINDLHYSLAMKSLNNGKHVVCEKPLAMNSSEARELVKIAKKRKLVNAVHFNIRFYPLIHQAKKMVEEGILGEIFAVNGSYQQDWLFFDTDYNWRLEPEFSGGSRAVADIGLHWLDSIEFITGSKVNKVLADFATFYPVRKKPLKSMETFSEKILKPGEYEEKKINTEDYATVLLNFSNGAHGSVTVNQVAAGRKNRFYFEIYGSKASIAFNAERPNELWIGHREKGNESIMKDPSLIYKEAKNITSFPGGHNEGFPDTSKQLFKKIYKYIRDDDIKKNINPDFPTFKDGLRSIILCEAIFKSAQQKKWIMVEE